MDHLPPFGAAHACTDIGAAAPRNRLRRILDECSNRYGRPRPARTSTRARLIIVAAVVLALAVAALP